MDTQKKYAIKCIAYKVYLQRTNNPLETLEQLGMEIAIMKKLDHPHIVKFYEAIHDPNKQILYLVMEYAAKGAMGSDKFWKYERHQRNKNDAGAKKGSANERKLGNL